MATLEWTTKANFDLGSVSGDISTSESPGDLVLTGSSGTWTSEAREAASIANWGVLRIPATMPEGSNVYVRVKVAATEGGLAGASWTDYAGGVLVDGEVVVNTRVLLLNDGVSTAHPWYQVELTMEKG